MAESRAVAVRSSASPARARHQARKQGAAPGTSEVVVDADPSPSGPKAPTAPRQPSTPQPITVNLTSGRPSGLSGAQNATLVLGAGLVAVSMWSDTLHPLLDSAWNGTPLKITLPAQGILAESAFVAALVFIASLSDDFAQLAFWFILALWTLFLVMHPAVVTTAAGWLTQGTQNSAPATPPQQSAGAPSQGGRAPHTSSF